MVGSSRLWNIWPHFYLSASSRVCSLCLFSRRALPCIRSSSAVMSQRSLAASRYLSVASPPILHRSVFNPSDVPAYYRPTHFIKSDLINIVRRVNHPHAKAEGKRWQRQGQQRGTCNNAGHGCAHWRRRKRTRRGT